MTERDLILLRQVRADAKSGRARKVRMDAGVTQSELGAAAGVHQATIALWELGRRRSTGAAALRYARLLHRLSAGPG